MMKKNLFFPLIISTILLSQPACKKYLDEKSDAGLLVPTTLEDFQSLLDDGNSMNYATPSFATSSADDYFLENSNYLSKSIFLQHVYRWEPYPYRFINDWANSYRPIYISNLCLERLKLVDRTSLNAQEWDNIKGTALFYKAFYYLELAWVFAKAYDETSSSTDMGIVLRESSDFMVPSVRASVQQSYDKVIADARQSVELLPAHPIVQNRPSKAAAFALLSRAYLSMRKYDSAGLYAHKALEIKNTLMNYNDAAMVAISSANPFLIYNPEVIWHGTMGLMVNIHSPGSGPARVDSNLFKSYHVNDLRRRAFFTAVGNYQRFKGSYSNNVTRLFSGIGTDEMYLTRAECFARAGDNDKALQDLNALLKMRFTPANFVPVATATALISLDSILSERRKELLFRGSLRWMDVKRLNKEGRNIEMKRWAGGVLYTLPPNDKRYALPIPEDVIEASGIPQN